MKKTYIFTILFGLLLTPGLTLFANHQALAASQADHQFLADVNDDGRDDSIVFFGNTGKWYVAKSDGQQFGAASEWMSGHGVGSAKQFVADVTCDGKADAVVYFSQNGNWYVAPSTGSNFNNGSPNFFPYRWLSGSGVGSVNQMLASQHGNGCVDAFVTFADGSWYEYDSPGASRWAEAAAGSQADLQTLPNQRFAGGHGVGSANQFAADTTGDGKAELVSFFRQDGSWYVSQYLGNGQYGFPNLWIKGHGAGSQKQLLGDIRAGFGAANAADAVAYLGNGTWSSAPAVRTQKFNPASGGWDNGTTNDYSFYIPYSTPTFDSSQRFGLGSSNQLIGNPAGDGNESNPNHPYVFFNHNGSWYDEFSHQWISGHGAGSM